MVEEIFRTQAELLLSIVLAAAAVNLSDNLNERGLELARRVVSADSARIQAMPPFRWTCSTVTNLLTGFRKSMIITAS